MTRQTQAHPANALVLRTAAVWGTYVVASRELNPGEALVIGDQPHALIARPDASEMAELPLRPVGNGWELDPRGVSGGVLYLRGRQEDPAALAKAAAPVPIVAGDYGVLQYGGLSLFFQYAQPSPAPRRTLRVDWPLVFAFLFAAVTFGGLILVLYLLFPTLELQKPIELTSPEELKVRFHHREPPPPPATKAEGGEQEGAKGAKDSRPKDKPQGSLSKRAPKPGPSSPSQADNKEAPKGLSAMTDAMSSEVGKEIQETLGTINTVAQALGGLDSKSLVLGSGKGLGLHSSGQEGGHGEGVMFGSGTLDTGFGTGAGAAGSGRGRGGSGGGLGRGNGSGSGSGLGGERGLAAADVPQRGQGLSAAQVARVVNARKGTYAACYDSATATNPNLRGNITVSFVIAPDGSVASANIKNSSLNNARVEGCVLRQFSRLRFPKADKTSDVSWPLVFNPGK